MIHCFCGTTDLWPLCDIYPRNIILPRFLNITIEYNAIITCIRFQLQNQFITWESKCVLHNKVRPLIGVGIPWCYKHHAHDFGRKGFIWLTWSHKSNTEKSHSIVLRKGTWKQESKHRLKVRNLEPGTEADMPSIDWSSQLSQPAFDRTQDHLPRDSTINNGLDSFTSIISQEQTCLQANLMEAFPHSFLFLDNPSLCQLDKYHPHQPQQQKWPVYPLSDKFPSHWSLHCGTENINCHIPV